MQKIVDFIKETFKTQEFIPLHEPRFIGNEKKYLNDCIDSTFVSSVGKYVDTFEKEFAKTVGSKFAIATVNGTAALHISLILADVKKDDEVLSLSKTEFDLLKLFLLNKETLLKRERIISDIWGWNASSNLLDVTIKNLRQKLGKDYIQTIRGIGYSLKKG